MGKVATQSVETTGGASDPQRDIELIEYEQKVQDADSAARSAKVNSLKEGQAAKAKLEQAGKDAKLKYATAFPVAEQQRADLEADARDLRTALEERLDETQQEYVKGVVGDSWSARVALRAAQKTLPAAQDALASAQKDYDAFKSLGD